MASVTSRMTRPPSSTLGSAAGRAIDRTIRIVRGWSAPAALTLLDQGTSAGANFVLQIILARRLEPAGYGAFNVAFAVYLILLSVVNSILFEPMSVLGPRSHERELDAYAMRLFRIQVVASLVLGLVMAATSRLYGPDGATVAEATAWFALSAPFLMAFQFLRRVCYLRTSPGSALRGSMAYAVVILGALAMLRGALSVPVATLIMGGAALAASAVMLGERGLLGMLLRGSLGRTRMRAELAACWTFGKWLLASSLVGWFAASSYVPLSAVMSGLGAAGAIRAVDNLFQPVSQGMTALASLASPWLSRRTRERGPIFVRNRMWLLGFAVSAGVAAYVAAIWWFGSGTIGLVYGSASPYLAAVPLIPVFGGVYVLRGLADVGLGTGLRALGNFRTAFIAAALSSAVMVVAGVPLMRSYGPIGMLAGMLLAGVANLVAMVPAAIRVRVVEAPG